MSNDTKEYEINYWGTLAGPPGGGNSREFRRPRNVNTKNNNQNLISNSDILGVAKPLFGGGSGGGGSMNPVQSTALTSGAAMAAGGMTDMVMSMIGGGKRRAEQKTANQEFNRTKLQYSQLDTSNPYENLQNPYEDLTVNQQQAQFEAQQSQQGLANTMGALQGAAGGSGIAALAQSIANQQSIQTQRASASIGMQEQRNQQMMAQGAMQNQTMERQGEVMSRQMQREQTSTMFGMAQQRKAAADEAREKATRGLIGGVFETAAGVGMAAIGG